MEGLKKQVRRSRTRPSGSSREMVEARPDTPDRVAPKPLNWRCASRRAGRGYDQINLTYIAIAISESTETEN